MTLVQWLGVGLIAWSLVQALVLWAIGNGPHRWFKE
jgi:hypothetical protein